jgi:hypothetical protein
MARAICTWAPSHASLVDQDPQAASLNFHGLLDDWFAVSRTVYGGPEYSGRRGFQVFTHFLLVRGQQLAGYENHPQLFARTAQSLGHLRLLMTVPDQLPTLDLPDRPLAPPSSTNRGSLEDVQRVLHFRRRVAVLGLDDPAPALSQMLLDTPKSDRLDVSFTTGLKPSVHREFRLHFYHQANGELQTQLASHGIEFVAL